MIMLTIAIFFCLIVLVIIMYGMAVRDIRATKILRTSGKRYTGIILPYIPWPSTFGELTTAYTIITTAPFAEAREGLHRPISTTLYPTLDPQIAHRYGLRDILYNTACKLITLAHIYIFISCFGLAILAHEPTYIIVYLICFYTWITWTIWRYPHMPPIQKIALIFLSPSMTWYFFYRLATAPVRELANVIK